MKALDIRAKSDDELAQLLIDLRKEQLNLRFQKSSGQLENTAQMRIVGRNIAKVKTIQTERAMATVEVKK